MKRCVMVMFVCLLIAGCKISMDDCYRAIYDYVGPEAVESFVMEVTQKGVIKDLVVSDEKTSAWVRTEPHMWIEVDIDPTQEHKIGDKVVVSLLVKFRKGGKLDIVDKWLD